MTTTGARITEQIIRNEHGSIIQSSKTVAPPTQSSVEISQNAKGGAQITVKVVHDDPETALTEAVRLYRLGQQLLTIPTEGSL